MRYRKSAEYRAIQLIELLEREIAKRDERIRVLEAREWARYQDGDRPVVAMPPPGPDPHAGQRWVSDETGLVGEWVPDEIMLGE